MRTLALICGLLLFLADQGTSFAKDFEFVVIGDTRPRFEQTSFAPFQKLIGKINQLSPALVINLGDLIYGYGMPSRERQWDKYQAVARTIQPVYYQLPGNHDTHSRAARRSYGRRFGKFYQSFDYEGCHFVLLDNTEGQRWGRIGSRQFEWLKRDLTETRANQIFVFMHFPVWEPERITPEYYEFWAKTLHPLFKASRVKAVFAGHYHAYGPTREFDGIRYFITGGGGAELRPEYRKSGGEFHFMKIQMRGDNFQVRVVTEHGEMTDSEADVMGGIRFASGHVSRIGIPRAQADLSAGLTFNVTIVNPYAETLVGRAEWVMDRGVFSVRPENLVLQIPPHGTRQHSFILQAMQHSAAVQSLPRLQFDVSAGAYHHRFHRELRLLEPIAAPLTKSAPVLDGDLNDWGDLRSLSLSTSALADAYFAATYDTRDLYIALRTPIADKDEAEELGFVDEVQIGFARKVTETDFGPDFLRLGLSSGRSEVHDRTAGHRTSTPLAGIRASSGTDKKWRTWELQVPMRFLAKLRPAPGAHLVLDVSFPLPDDGPESPEPGEPEVNTMPYRIRYGSDSLVPVYFIDAELAAP